MSSNIPNAWIIAGGASIALVSAAIGWSLNERLNTHKNGATNATVANGHGGTNGVEHNDTVTDPGDTQKSTQDFSEGKNTHLHSKKKSKRERAVKVHKENLKAIDMSTEEHAYCLQQLNDERIGRTRAEKRLRDMVSASINTMGYAALPIGKVMSPFSGRRGAPRQGSLAIDVRTKIAFANSIPAESLRGLRSFSHVFVIFLFHENTSNHKFLKPNLKAGADASSDVLSVEMSNAVRKRPWQPLVKAPALRGERTGVFASRSPHRPNAIGITLCRVVGLEGCEEDEEEEEKVLHFDTPFESIRYFSLRHTSAYVPKSTTLELSQKRNKSNRRFLLLSGCDLLDGTPILDIKPFAPFDCPTCFGTLMTPALSTPPPVTPVDLNDPLALAQTILKARPQTYDIEKLRSEEQFAPPTTVADACNVLLKAEDIPSSFFSLHGPHWVFSSLVAQAKGRLPVVWGPNTQAVVEEAVRTNQCRFYGQDAGFFEALHPSIATPCTEFPAELQEQRLRFETTSLMRAITQVLSLDIRSAHQGRGDLPSKSVAQGGAKKTEKEAEGAATEAGGGAAENDAQSIERQDYSSPDIFVSSSSPSFIRKQSYELYYDSLHIRFAFREFPTTLEVATTQRWPCYVHIDEVSIVPK